MDVHQLVRDAHADGIHLLVLPNGNLKITGYQAAHQKWGDLLKVNKSQIIPVLTKGMLEFNSIYNFVAPLASWNNNDYQAWLMDYLINPDQVLKCLRALRCSWKEGRYGWILSRDWSQ